MPNEGPGVMRVGRALIPDAVLASVLTVFGIVGTAFAGASSGARADLLCFALVVVAALVLSARRLWPQPVLVVVTACTVAYLLLGYPYGPILVSFMISVYSVARHAVPARSVRFSLVALGVMLIHPFVNNTRLGAGEVFPVSAWVAVPYALGYTLRVRHQTAQRARAEAIRERVSEERLRVAQEVHDIVGHGLAAIKMQADIALHVLAKKPDQAEVALEAISRTSSDALDELRATLAMIRGREDAGRSPVPSLTRLDELRERMAEAGIYVRLVVSGEPPAPLPVAVDLTGYRIVQESLTNVLRHSGAGEAVVDIRYLPDAVRISVSNAMTDVPSGRKGFGITGMRERVLALGGEFSAGPTRDDRFEVHARLPIGGPP
jgi:signal transduction histidine kinase